MIVIPPLLGGPAIFPNVFSRRLGLVEGVCNVLILFRFKTIAPPFPIQTDLDAEAEV